MIRKLLLNEEANAALVVALGTTAMALAARGPGRASMKRTLSAVLSNPIPRRETYGVRSGTPSSVPGREVAA
jgi:hypothetical protein